MRADRVDPGTRALTYAGQTRRRRRSAQRFEDRMWALQPIAGPEGLRWCGGRADAAEVLAGLRHHTALGRLVEVP